MRTTRVMLVFFSAGFLAGSFEQAAGVGQLRPAPKLAHDGPAKPQPTRLAAPLPPAVPLPKALSPAALPEPVAADINSPTHRLDGSNGALPIAQKAFARILLPEPDLPGTADVLAGLGVSESDLQAMAFWTPGQPGGQQMSRPSHAAWTPMPSPPFVSLPPPRGSVVPDVPGANITEEIHPPAEKQVVAPPAPEFILPIHRGRVTSMWNQGRRHPAIDLAAPLGTPVRATTRKQKVTYAGWRGGYGNLVTTRDPQGREHYYGHLQRIVARIGTLLDQGDLLGLLGSTGHSTGPHVHYEVRTRGRNVNPAGLLFPSPGVSRGYAWNEGGRPAAVAVASVSDTAIGTRTKARVAKATRAKARWARARVAKARRSTARLANARRVRHRIAHRATPRIAGRYAPRPRYSQPQRSIRSARRYSGRYARR